ncbi:hypothetical protein COR50_14145 [Chitinophaga caeni]|uniref:Uncharacterized protein n=1 Tax=Chitinophaga caeni TaxID=2029983 RepID=A0A291QWE9_9BACT|nr:hypothetical protein [Chitinophaga caeni]ATL48212.1 hypothetical protein COR50_14145 [Chitinophaga caeni]
MWSDGCGGARDAYVYDCVGNLVKDFSGGIDKIGKITKSGGGILDYSYAAGGQRVSKAFTPPGEATKTTWYLREPSGNVLAVYEQ